MAIAAALICGMWVPSRALLFAFALILARCEALLGLGLRARVLDLGWGGQGISHTGTALDASTSSTSGDVMAFGNRVDIKIMLPSRDRTTVLEFLRDEESLLDATWERGKYRRLSDDSKYLLLFPELVLPGVDTISPEVEVQFIYKNGLIEMQSGNWTLRGMSGTVLKDSRFVQSFNIVVRGELGIHASTPPEASAPIVASGWVEYRVQGEKPGVFKNAPPFVLDVTIKLIQDTVSEFATNQFSTRLLRGFRTFVMSRVRY